MTEEAQGRLACVDELVEEFKRRLVGLAPMGQPLFNALNAIENARIYSRAAIEADPAPFVWELTEVIP